MGKESGAEEMRNTYIKEGESNMARGRLQSNEQNGGIFPTLSTCMPTWQSRLDKTASQTRFWM